MQKVIEVASKRSVIKLIQPVSASGPVEFANGLDQVVLGRHVLFSLRAEIVAIKMLLWLGGSEGSSSVPPNLGERVLGMPKTK